VAGVGWIPAGELREGQALVGLGSDPLVVEELGLTERFETVYNFRVAMDHTYFVGADDWGFAAWVHNARYEVRFDKATNQHLIWDTLTGKDTGSRGSQTLMSQLAGQWNAPRKITQGQWGAIINYNSGSQRAIDHIADGHFFNSRPSVRSSRFSAGNSTVSRVKSMVDEAIANGSHASNSRGDYSVTYTFGDVIGTDMYGRKTKSIQVFLDDVGNVLNAYPIPKP